MITKGYANSHHGQIHYREAGASDAPVLCFFHQTASSGVMFEKVMARLADDYHCFAFDSPGFGQSYQPDAIPDMDYVADRLMEAITDLGMTSFHACGHHTGGCAAMAMAVNHSDSVKSLTVIGPVLVNEEERKEYMKTFVRPFAIEETGAFLQGAWDYLRMIGAGGSVDLHNREMADHLIAHNSMPMAFTAVWSMDVADYFMKITCPLMIMCSKDDVLWPLFERAGEMRPDATQCIVGGGDFQPDNDPDGVARGIKSFLTKGSQPIPKGD